MEAKRKTVGTIVEQFKYADSNLEELLKVCITALKGDLEELPFMKDMIVEGGLEAEINYFVKG